VRTEREQRIGLVLGGGGTVGAAWLMGTLDALAGETGWDPGSADYVVGTSAGSVVGALLACGVPPWLMVAHQAGESLDGLSDSGGEAADRVDRSGGSRYRLDRKGFALGPGSWRLAAASLAHPTRYSPMSVLSGWLPEGLVSTEPIKDTVRRVCRDPWAPHPNYWAVAVDYDDGHRVAFGRDGAPRATLPDAVAASCAIPGFYRTVQIDGRRYVDGGVRSASNLDILRDESLDLVIALNPMSSLESITPRGLPDRLAVGARAMIGRRLGSEARRLRGAGTEVVLIQPTAADLTVMGPNPMNGRRRGAVMAAARRTMAEQLRDSEIGDRLRALPVGESVFVRRPVDPPSSWPDFYEATKSRWLTAPVA
jgi:NTE family protein